MSRHESPDVIAEGLSRALAERIAGWILSEDPSEERHKRAWVVGVYGERGAGKTSALLTLLDVLQNHEQAGKLALPRAEGDDHERAVPNLLKPADLRDHDELLFELLRHLEERYEHDLPSEDPFHCARELEVQRTDIKRFLKYEQEVGASYDELRRGHIRIRSEVASSTVKLKEAFNRIIDRLRREGQLLVLLVDDLDLHPERALDLLEIFHIFLDQPGVVIVLAADKPLLLDGIELGLKRSRGLKKRSDLAAALLAKYVPYEWYIPIPTEPERFDLLWPPAESTRELWRWWPSEEQARRIPQATAQEPYSSARELAEDLLGVLLPVTYRSLYGFENRLRHVCDELGCNAQGRITLEEHAPRSESLALGVDMLPAFLSGVLAFDVLFPRHMLWNRVLTHPEDVYYGFEAVLADEESTEWQPLLSGFDRLSPHEQREAHIHLHALARLWKTLQQHGTAPEIRRFLAISLNLDARDKSRKRWEGSYDAEQVNDWHIDLRAFIDDPQRADREELVAARREAEALLRAKDIASSARGVDVFLKANLPFATWLGWELRYLQDVQVLNESGGVFTSFPGPGQELDPDNTGRPELLEESRRTGSGPEGSAVLLIDVLGHSQPEQLDAFTDERGEPVAYKEGVHLLGHLGRGVRPEHAEPFLRDCVEALGQLKRQGIEHVHLGLSMPDTLAFLLGQQLHARVSRISLYEYRRTRAGYEYIFDLEDHG